MSGLMTALKERGILPIRKDADFESLEYIMKLLATVLGNVDDIIAGPYKSVNEFSLEE
jgi:hypothetical protein